MMIKNTIVVLAMLTSLGACSQNNETNTKETPAVYGTVEDGSVITITNICEVSVKGEDYKDGDTPDQNENENDDPNQNEDEDCVEQEIILSLDANDAVTDIEYLEAGISEIKLENLATDAFDADGFVDAALEQEEFDLVLEEVRSLEESLNDADDAADADDSTDADADDSTDADADADDSTDSDDSSL